MFKTGEKTNCRSERGRSRCPKVRSGSNPAKVGSEGSQRRDFEFLKVDSGTLWALPCLIFIFSWRTYEEICFTIIRTRRKRLQPMKKQTVDPGEAAVEVRR